MLLLAQIVVNASWVALLAYFAWAWAKARKNRTEAGRKTNPLSLVGMTLELAAFLVLPFFRRPDPGWPDAVYGFAALLAVASTALSIAGGVYLGKQLRIQAVVTDEHRLITGGPYAVVRHPIYASLIGLLISIALTHCDPRVFWIAGPMLLVATELRVRSEDVLLKSHFGPEFEEYRKRVSAYLPGIR